MAKKKKKRGKAAYAKGKSVGASAIKTRKATRATYKTKRTKPSAGGR